MRLFNAFVMLALAAVVIGTATADPPTKYQSELKLVSPSGHVSVWIKADDNGAAIWMTDNGGCEQRIASLTTRANDGNPALCLHRDLRNLAGGFDAAISSDRNGGIIQLGHKGKVVFIDKDTMIVPRKAVQAPKEEQQTKAGRCNCTETGDCTCPPGKCQCAGSVAMQDWLEKNLGIIRRPGKADRWTNDVIKGTKGPIIPAGD
jgi:hypothetical protein